MNFFWRKRKAAKSRNYSPTGENRKIKSRRRLPNVCSLPLAVVLLDDDKQGVVEHSNLISELPGRGEGPPEENFGGAQLPRYPLAPGLPPRSFWLWGHLFFWFLRCGHPLGFSSGVCFLVVRNSLSSFVGISVFPPIFPRNLFNVCSICCSSLGSHVWKT